MAVLALYTASRVAAHAAGVSFDAGELASFWHFINPELLRTALVESVLYQHTLPPLYNLYLGVGLKLAGEAAPLLYWATHLASGAVLALTLQGLTQRLGVPAPASVIAAAAFVASPASILYESFLFYTWFEPALLCTAALVLHRALLRDRGRDWIAFFALLCATTLLRSLFHLLWMAACVAAVLAGHPRRRRLLLAAALPALLAVAPYVKNAVLFGEATSSSWFGMSMARMTLRQLPEDTKREWIARGRLAPIAAVRPFGHPASYYAYVPRPAPTGHAVLDEESKPSGAPNLHHLVFVEVARRFLHEALVVMKTSPGVYAGSVGMALARYFEPASDYPPLRRNRRRLATLDRLYNGLLHWSWGFSHGGFMLPLLPATVVYGVTRARRAWRTGGRPRALTLLFLSGTIVWVTLVGCLFEIGENNRFRFSVEPFILTLAVLAALELTAHWRRAASPAGLPNADCP